MWEVVSHLNYARYRAIFKGESYRVVFSRECCAVEKYNQELKEWKNEKVNFLEGATLQANNSPTFHPQGTVSNLASIIVANAWGEYKITLAISGRIKVARF